VSLHCGSHLRSFHSYAGIPRTNVLMADLRMMSAPPNLGRCASKSRHSSSNKLAAALLLLWRGRRFERDGPNRWRLRTSRGWLLFLVLFATARFTALPPSPHPRNALLVHSRLYAPKLFAANHVSRHRSFCVPSATLVGLIVSCALSLPIHGTRSLKARLQRELAPFHKGLYVSM